MKKIQNVIILTLALCVGGCVIGTDTVEDEIRSIDITANEAAILIGNSVSFKATLTNNLGKTFGAPVTWISSNTAVASINAEGVLTGVSKGQVVVNAKGYTVKSNDVTVTIVDSQDVLASVVITTTTRQIALGGTLQFTAKGSNINEQEVALTDIKWKSSDESVLTIDAGGLATGVAQGKVSVTASVGEITSDELKIQVGENKDLTGTFKGLNGYNVSGSVSLITNSDDTFGVKLGDDFRAQSGPGLYVYLANSEANENGIELGKLTSNSGSSTYSVPNNIDATTFSHVIILCKPFNIPFGAAALN